MANTTILDDVFDPSKSAARRMVGDHRLLITLPKKAILVSVGIEVITAFSSAEGLAAIFFGANAAGDFGAGYSAAELVAGFARFQRPNECVKVTAQRQLIITVADEALLSGKAYIYAEYLMGHLS